mmetsp:Transcript_28081/g.82653  ORF Transcript_28081/g.82653 Transcript_28081/m.82653 type:complete len:235 (+) Transcript_28081:679-1383(+)
MVTGQPGSGKTTLVRDEIMATGERAARRTQHSWTGAARGRGAGAAGRGAAWLLYGGGARRGRLPRRLRRRHRPGRAAGRALAKGGPARPLPTDGRLCGGRRGLRGARTARPLASSALGRRPPLRRRHRRGWSDGAALDRLPGRRDPAARLAGRGGGLRRADRAHLRPPRALLRRDRGARPRERRPDHAKDARRRARGAAAEAVARGGAEGGRVGVGARGPGLTVSAVASPHRPV